MNVLVLSGADVAVLLHGMHCDRGISLYHTSGALAALWPGSLCLAGCTVVT
jgi:hypothetical protein